ncbi:MAG: ubiquinol-cytochrome c reductase iron-sulfur subunit [Xanthomonadaceae bacterium]|nr:ubiquinol-cytochrome c reductase iron-sulfur subunit [Xanthomonadaceae bacterium]
MSNDGVDLKKRRFLTIATSVVGGLGVVAAGVPFAASLRPSERARALGAPVEVDVSRMEPGSIQRVQWRGRPVWVVHRTDAVLERLPSVEGKLRDPASQVLQQPAYAANPHRSIRPEFLVLVGSCTHLGCSPSYRPEVAPADLGPEWQGGFFCACHGSRFDLAGRVYQGVPAPTNLLVPPHHYVSDTVIRVGEEQGAAA